MKTIAIFAAKIDGVLPWDPQSVHRGIAGSEEAVIYMAEELAHLGNRILVFGDPPADSPYTSPTANPRFVGWDFAIQSNCFDAALSCRMPQLGTILKQFAKKVFLWPQDILTSPLSKSQINAFDDVFWISKWQRKQWVSINCEFENFKKIYGNGINIADFSPIVERENPHACIYGSNYARGLEVLLDLWPEIKMLFPQATLDIYYGWQHWGTLSSEKEAKMRKQISYLSDSGVTHHGLVSHKKLHDAYANASLWTYPCISCETFCITALKAQFSGAIPVIIKNSALHETVQHGYACSSPEEFFSILRLAMKEAEHFPIEKRQKMRDFISHKFTWKRLAQEFQQQIAL